MTRSMLTALGAGLLLVASPAQARDAVPRDSTVPQLLEFLKTGSEDARREACKRLGDRRDPGAVPAIGELVLKDPAAKVRITCVRALEAMGVNPAAAPFVAQAALKDPDAKVRQEALESLADVDPQGAGPTAAQALMQDKDPAVRMEACEAIAEGRWKDAEPAVLQVLGGAGTPQLRKACVPALVAIGNDAGYAVAHKLMTEEPDDDVRREASAQVERHPRSDSLPFLCKALADRDDRIVGNAIKGLKNLGRKEGAACLREAAKTARSDRHAGNMNKAAGELER